MTIYNFQISRSGKSGRYSIVSDDGQQRQFFATHWRPVVVGEPTYAGEGVMDVVENSEYLRLRLGDLLIVRYF